MSNLEQGSNMEPTNELWETQLFYDQVRRNYEGWHIELRKKFSLHPTVVSMIKYKPANVEKLVLEWPHISETDTTRLAYTRSPADGENNRQLITSIGKYLSRHWPSVSDHLRRDAAVLYTPDEMYFVHTLPEIVMGVELGPYSCMASASGGLDFTDYHHHQMLAWIEDKTQPEPPWENHPYNAYAPDLGWHMALRKNSAGVIMARAMCYDKMFVRTYRRGNEVDAYSHADEVLAAWLQEQGYTHEDSWPDGTKLRCEQLQCPYLDGSTQKIEHLDGDIYVVAEYGNYEADSTNGYAQERDCDDDEDDDDEDEDSRMCVECGESNHVDDMYYVGRNDDQCVCESCRDNNYTYVRGEDIARRGGFRTYYVKEENAEPVAHREYCVDVDHVPDNVIELTDDPEGHKYAELDDTVCIDGEYYLSNRDDIVELSVEAPNTGDSYAFRLNTWKCAATGNIYHNGTECVVIDKKYHPDDVPQIDDAGNFIVRVVTDESTTPLFGALNDTACNDRTAQTATAPY